MAFPEFAEVILGSEYTDNYRMCCSLSLIMKAHFIGSSFMHIHPSKQLKSIMLLQETNDFKKQLCLQYDAVLLKR